MTFSKNTLAIIQQLLAGNKVGVYDQNADANYSALMTARTEVDAAIRELTQPVTQ